VTCAPGGEPLPDQDPISRMFAWWNAAFKIRGAYTESAFARHFTPDAELIVDGRLVARGLDAWARHFQGIQAEGGEAEIVLPFKEVFRQADRLYTYHVIRARRNGELTCMLAAGHAVMRDDKIASITLVRAELDPVLEAACRTW
jgi:ketosteroid isomerase-like protein